jgi:hypothetical protein
MCGPKFRGNLPECSLAYWPALIDRTEIEPGLVVEVSESPLAA